MFISLLFRIGWTRDIFVLFRGLQGFSYARFSVLGCDAAGKILILDAVRKIFERRPQNFWMPSAKFLGAVRKIFGCLPQNF